LSGQNLDSSLGVETASTAVIIVIGCQPTVAAMRINAHITRFWRDPGDHAGDKGSAHNGGSARGY
jgi:hypothetical protein